MIYLIDSLKHFKLTLVTLGEGGLTSLLFTHILGGVCGGIKIIIKLIPGMQLRLLKKIVLLVIIID